MSDEIKARIVIEADTSGADEAAAALEKLQEMAGGEGGIGDALASQFEKGTKGAEEFAGAVEGIEEPLKSGEEAVTGLNEALDEHQQAIEDTASAYEGLQEPVENVSKGITAVQDSLEKSTPAFSHAAENMSVFQDALSNPEPFNTVRDYLDQTGQSWGDFIDAVGPENANRLVNVQNNLNGISNGFAEVDKSAGTFTDTFTSTQAAMDEFNQSDPWASFNAGAQGASKAVEQVDTSINKFGGIGASQYGPLTLSDTLAKNWGLAGNEAEKAIAQMGLAEEGGGLGGVFKGAFGELGGVLNSASQFVMPLMALQMVGTMVAQVGQSIYDSAAIAEGPGAHGIGTFTGTVDALGQSLQATGQTFSEGFGQNMLPTLNALNDQMNQGGGSNLGGVIGSTTSFLSNLGLLAGGLTTVGINPFSNQMIQTGGEGLINQVAQAFGFQQPFQGPGPQAQAQIDYQQKFSQLSQTVGSSAYQSQLSADTLIQEGLDPNYLQQQNYLGAAQQFYQRQQANWNASHYISPQQAALNYQNQREMGADQAAYQQYLASGGTPITPDNPYGTGGTGGGFFSSLGNIFSGLSGLNSGGFMDFAKNLMSFGQGIGDFFGLGGSGSVGTRGPIQAAGFTGSMSPGGIGTETTTLAHTFIANVSWEANNLEKQFTAVASWAAQGLEHAVTAVAHWAEQNVQHAVTAIANWAEQNVVHPVVAVAEWAEQNVQHAVTAIAQWTEQNVQHAVTAIAQWTEQNLIHPVTAIAQWAERNLEHLFVGVASWVGQNLTHTFIGVAQWIQQTITSVMPAFAEGVENYSGGLAMVGEGNSPEVIGHNGQYMLVGGPTFVNLPPGASVYPLSDLSSSSSPRQLATGTVGDTTPISLPILGMGSGGAHTANITVNLDSQTLISLMGASLMSSVNVGLGKRSY